MASERRIQFIEKSLDENYDLLAQYERRLLLESDPREQLKTKENITWINARIAELEHQLEELQNKAQAAAPELVVPQPGLPFAANHNPIETHFSGVITLLKQGKVIPVLGPGVNLCGRPAGVRWKPGQYLPSPEELSAHLAESFEYPEDDHPGLPRVSQYATIVHRPGPFYDRLRYVYDAIYPPTLLHEFWANLPLILRNKAPMPRYPIIITTNYDDLLERAYGEANEPYDLLAYASEGEHRNKFVHLLPGSSEWIPIDDPNKYLGLRLEQRPVILKMYGALERFNAGQDSLVITEDQLINYMTRTEISKLIPASLMRELRSSSLLFMGYNLRDWSLRVILHRIWGEREHRLNDYESWAIEPEESELSRKFWKKWDVELLPMSLEEYINGLSERLQALTPSRGRK